MRRITQGQSPCVNHLESGIALQRFDEMNDSIEILDSELDDVDCAWGICLVGFTLDWVTGEEAVRKSYEFWTVSDWVTDEEAVRKSREFWIVPEICTERGWSVFKFKDEKSRSRVLNGGPYVVNGRPLLLKIMPKCFALDEEDVHIMPVWVTLPGLPPDCWNAKILSRITSKVGKPIQTDEITSTRRRKAYARVLVEIDTSKPLVHNVSILLPTGKTRNQPVIFEHELKFCTSCKTFGHLTDTCRNVDMDKSNAPTTLPSQVQQKPESAAVSSSDVKQSSGKLNSDKNAKDKKLSQDNNTVTKQDASRAEEACPEAPAASSSKGLDITLPKDPRHKAPVNSTSEQSLTEHQAPSCFISPSAAGAEARNADLVKTRKTKSRKKQMLGSSALSRQ